MRCNTSSSFVLTVLTLVASAASSTPVHGQNTPGPTESTAPEARRIFHLQSGQTIRVLAREKDGGFEYHGKEGWKSLAPGMVLSSELESDVLKEWNAKKAVAAPSDVAARTKLADWALSAGLAVEGLEEMTAVLALDPDRKEALDSLAAHADVMNVPKINLAGDLTPDRTADSLSALLRFGASVPGAARELAVIELGRAPRDEALQKELLAELRSKIVTRRSFAALALRRLLPGQAVKPLILHAVLDPSDEVRKDSSLALRTMNEPGVIVPIVRVLEKSPSSDLRRNAAEALGNAGYAAAVQPLVARLSAAASDAGSAGRVPHAHIFVGTQVAYIQDFDVEVAQFQAVADPKVNTLIEGSVLDAAVAGVQNGDVSAEVATARTSLERLTHASPGKTSKAWLAWWDANGSKWRSEDLSSPHTEGARSSGG
ncbi:MAG TPA: HEAT repeat domain-containing protein [Thermoanaerobaculia bacterium]|nr:HEAT repeat domain-containing protein [Thermoanaerobaculia bacterium]